MKIEKPNGYCQACGQAVPNLFRICVKCSNLKIEGKPRLQLTGLSSRHKGWA